MGIVASCQRDVEGELFTAIGEGDLQHVRLLLECKPKLIHAKLLRSASSPIHYAASLGQPDVLVLLLEKGASVDALNHNKQTPLMLACKNRRIACIDRLIEWGANILIFDTPHGRTCLHYTAKSGHIHCLQKVLNAAQLPAVSQTWGFVQFINVRDGSGATPLHLAARSCHPSIVQLLLHNGALVCAPTTKFSSNCSSLGFGSTPLHFAARGGSVECVKELLAWGADRLQRNSQGHTPFFIAMKYHNTACASLLNPLTAEPLVWPSPWKFMSNLDPDAKVLLEAALAQANDAWEKRAFSARGSYGAKSNELLESGSEAEDDEEVELCCICFEHTCTIEVRDCRHQMCAGCMLALCCHNKPNPAMPCSPPPVCPFCRCGIEQLRKVQPKMLEEQEEEGLQEGIQTKNVKDENKDISKVAAMNKHKKLGDGGSSSSFMEMVSKGSFRLLASARNSGRVVDIHWD